MADKDTRTTEEWSDRAWELAEKIRIGLLTTWDGTEQKTRPLSATVKQEEHAIYFLVSADGEKNGEIEAHPRVGVTFADNGGNKYVSLSGLAEISNDRAKIEELWSPFAKAWWDSADDPDIRVLTVVPDRAEVWDSANMAVATVVMLTAAVTGGNPPVGKHREVRM